MDSTDRKILRQPAGREVMSPDRSSRCGHRGLPVTSVWKAVVVLTVVVTMAVEHARAGFIAADISGGSTFQWSQQTGSMSGWKFSTTNTVNATQLGYYDHGGNGLTEGHQVGIWNIGGDLLVSATVSAGGSDPLVNGFRYVDIAPTALPPGTYVIGGHTTAHIDTLVETPNVVAGPHVKFEGDQFEQWTTFAFPSIHTSLSGMFGPNFQYELVPEPSSFTLWMIAAAVVSMRRRRRPRPT